jgi:hypothetical protein
MEHFENHFDPCPIDPDEDGLEIDWESPAFVNPPYSEPGEWVEKAIRESRKGTDVVMLLKCDPSTQWYRLLEEEGARFSFINSRLEFKNSENGKNDRAYFPSVLVFLEGGKKERESGE